MRLHVEIAVVLDGKRTILGTIPLEFSVEHHERKYVTKRQQQILDLVAAGKSNKEIAGELCISERTAKFHVTSLLHRYAVKSRIELIGKAKL